MRKLLFIIAIFSIATAFQPQNKEELQSALTQWGVDASAAEAIYGHVSSWDVSLITDMSNLFPGTGYYYGHHTDYCCENNDANICHMICEMINYSPGPHPFESYDDCFEVFYEDVQSGGDFDDFCGYLTIEPFNEDINQWDVSNVTDMSGMFYGAHAFNQDLSSWDVSNVTTMYSMFKEAVNFNGDISDWDTGNVEYMSYMFENATSFNQDLNWDVSSVTIMENMFEGAVNFNGDISNWNPINVWKFYRMFRNAESFNQDLYWDISSGTNFTYMFKDAVNFNGDLSSFNTSGGDYFTEMFCNAHSFNQDVSHFDISNATYTARMFDGTSSLSLENKCAIHNSFSVQGGPWAYDWSSACDCINVDDDNICDDDDDCIGQYDECNVCNGDNSSCQDECGIPNGDNSTCSDCAGVPNGNSWESNCGCVPYDNTGNDCDDCAGTPNGDAVVDECGVCNGNSNPQDCNNDGIDDVCEETYDIGFDTGFFEGQSTGDINHDGNLTVTDIVIIIDNILND